MNRIAAAAAFLLVVVACVGSVQVKGKAMEPAIHDGERVTYERYDGGQLNRGEIVIFNSEGGTGAASIKRIVGLPGETVRWDGGRVLIDDQSLDEPYLAPGTQTTPQSPQVGTKYVVPADSYFVLGDNRIASSDSRSFGAVTRSQVFGKIKR